MKKVEPLRLQLCVVEDSVLLRQDVAQFPEKKNVLLEEQTIFTLYLQEKPELTL
jgi:hypothetical protein